MSDFISETMVHIDFLDEETKKFVLEYMELVQRRGKFFGSLAPMSIVNVKDNPELFFPTIKQTIDNYLYVESEVLKNEEI